MRATFSWSWINFMKRRVNMRRNHVNRYCFLGSFILRSPWRRCSARWSCVRRFGVLQSVIGMFPMWLVLVPLPGTRPVCALLLTLYFDALYSPGDRVAGPRIIRNARGTAYA